MSGYPRSARQFLTDYGLSEGVIDAILSIHAHELAEQIRNWDGPDSVAERWADGLSDAADFIDPKARTGEVRGCAT